MVVIMSMNDKEFLGLLSSLPKRIRETSSYHGDCLCINWEENSRNGHWQWFIGYRESYFEPAYIDEDYNKPLFVHDDSLEHGLRRLKELLEVAL